MMDNPTICFMGKGKVELIDGGMPGMEPGLMLVKTLSTQISIGTEMTILMKDSVESDSAWDKYGAYPFVAGYTNIGTIIEAGEGVDPSWLGKKVASYGVHAKYVLAAPGNCHVVPDELAVEEALFFVMSEIAMNGIRKARVSWGDVVVVYGAGLIGQFAARYSEMAGAQYVFVVDVSENRLSMLPKNDTIIPVNRGVQDVTELVLKKNNNRKPDIVIEATGSAGIIPEEAALVRDNGKLVILSSPRGKTSFDFHDFCNSTSIKIIGAHNCSHPASEEEENPWTKSRDAGFFFNLLLRGKLSVSNLITHRVPYQNALSAYHMLMEDRTQAAGIIINWN